MVILHCHNLTVGVAHCSLGAEFYIIPILRWPCHCHCSTSFDTVSRAVGLSSGLYCTGLKVSALLSPAESGSMVFAHSHGIRCRSARGTPTEHEAGQSSAKMMHNQLRGKTAYDNNTVRRLPLLERRNAHAWDGGCAGVMLARITACECVPTRATITWDLYPGAQ